VAAKETRRLESTNTIQTWNGFDSDSAMLGLIRLKGGRAGGQNELFGASKERFSEQ
jgi:hypothetical protein